MQHEQPLQGTHKGRPRFFLGSSRMCRFSTISCTSYAGRASRLLACWEDVTGISACQGGMRDAPSVVSR